MLQFPHYLLDPSLDLLQCVHGLYDTFLHLNLPRYCGKSNGSLSSCHFCDLVTLPAWTEERERKKLHWRKSRIWGELATAVFFRTSREKKAFCRRGLYSPKGSPGHLERGMWLLICYLLEEWRRKWLSYIIFNYDYTRKNNKVYFLKYRFCLNGKSYPCLAL